ncbi:hypothetical protein BGZ75_002698 [Mortierella antarctica]|nr:hypothetical protein BGZ75_002698 [Mortierella antarctica]
MTAKEAQVPHVMIVGAGLAGLLMGLLLDRINVPYSIYERAAEVKPLGSAMSLSVNILTLFDQLGLLDEVMKLSKPMTALDLYSSDMTKIGAVGVKDYKSIAGYPGIIFARPEFYDLLRSKIPADKVHMRKKILSIEQNQFGVMIRCSDNTTYHGDILVGADGAYSGVRQALYKTLEKKNQLPKADSDGLQAGYLAMVGVSTPQDPDKYPELKDETAHFRQIVGEQRISWYAATISENRICWRLTIQLDSGDAKAQMFRNSEWGPESNAAMIEEFYHLACPFGGKMGDIIDATPKDRISLVSYEQKLFETWFDGRTCLIGDACHKMLPQGGQGAINAMQDAVILTNCLYEMGEPTVENIRAAFQTYYNHRFPWAKKHVETSDMLMKLMSGQTFTERLMRNIMFNYLPSWMASRHFIKAAAYRPQASFLPQVPPRGTGEVLPQMPSKRYAAEQEMAKQNQDATSSGPATAV